MSVESNPASPGPVSAADLSAMDKAGHLHPFTSIADQQARGPHVFVSGEGVRVRDAAGREYLDAMAGLWCVNIGYGRARMGRAIAAQVEKLAYYHSFIGATNEPAIRLADRLARMAPGTGAGASDAGGSDGSGNGWKVFFGCTGSDANDTNLKLIWQYNNLRGRPEKKKILARRGSYHGVTIASASMGGLPHLQARFDLPLGDRFHLLTRPSLYWDGGGRTEADFVAHLAKELEETIAREGADTIAAFAAEPVMGAGGVIVPPETYFDAIVPILRKHDILVLSDEVVCGFGRLGARWGCERYRFQPDIVTIAKGVTSGYVPLSASLVSDAVWSVFRDASPEVGPFSHGFTYTAHPVCAAAALENLDIWEEEGLAANAAKVGAHLHRLLDERVATHPLVGEKRGLGLIAAIEFVADREKRTPFDLKLGVTRRMYDLMLAEGLIARPIFNAIAMSPPMVLSESEAEEIVDKFERALKKLTEALRADGTWKG